MSNWSPDDLTDKPRRRRAKPLLKVLVALAIAGGSSAWVATASPWAPEVQAVWAQTPVARQVVDAQAWWRATPVAGALGWLWSLGDSQTAIARLAPADTRVYIELAPSWWTRWWLGGWAQAKDGPRGEALAQMRTYAREQWNLDWDQDLAPWLGTDFGAIGRSSGLNGSAVDEFTLLAEARDQAAADALIAKLAARQPGALTVTRAGTTYQVLQGQDGQSLALGRLGGWLVVATPPRALDALIDHQASGRPSLLTNRRYQRIAGAWARGAVGHAFLDGGAAGADVAPDAKRRQPANGWPVPEAGGASFSAGGDWAILDWVTAFDTTQATAEDRARWAEALPAIDMGRFDALPSSTVLAVGGTATPAMIEALQGPTAVGWAPMGGGPGAGATFAGLLGALRTVRGPFAIGVTAGDPNSAIAPVGAVVALRPDDPAALRTALAAQAQALSGNTDPARLPGKLGEWASMPGLRGMLPGVMTVVDETHRGTAWKVVKTQNEGLAGWTAEGAEVVLAGGAPALAAVQADRFEALSATKSFRGVRGRLPARPAFYGFLDGVNAGKLLMASPLLPARYASQGAQALASLEGLGLAVGAGLDAAGFHHAALSVVVAAPQPEK